MANETMSVHQVAKYLNVGVTTIYKLSNELRFLVPNFKTSRGLEKKTSMNCRTKGGKISSRVTKSVSREK